ncbi:MAG: MmgE/PrpD family protein [Betaproteobacteria bacterium]|nr:MmgE/PrpD family protein [Betaproteobacteria bacterium]MBK9605738.1 MmgE/PrpD family protein [Betaproteobacteria bacterium]
MATISEALADLATQPVTPAEIERARRMRTYALDTLAVTLSGTISPSSAAVARTILAAAGKPEATVLGAGRGTSAWDAALANGAFAHALELDDDHRIAVLHPGAVVVPAALAAAEAAPATGLTFLRALLHGYEVTCRLGEVFRGSQFYHGVHPTALCGVFGAAMAAGVAMGLNRDALVRALGIAGTQASGLTEWRADGSWIKRLHPGRAAHAGVLSARLAAEGFTGPATIFEGANGFFNAFSYGEKIDPLCMTRDLGTDYRALGTALKPYPCCRFEHGAIDLAIEAHRNGVAPADIAAVAIRIYRTDVLSYHHEPKNPVDAQFNVPYGVAVALLRGKVMLSDFTDAAIRDEQVLAIARRITVTEDDGYTARYPSDYWVELKLRLLDGSERRYFSECPSGDPEASQYSNDNGLLHAEAERKSAALLAECGFGERADALRLCVAGLAEASGVKELAAILGPVPAALHAAHRR